MPIRSPDGPVTEPGQPESLNIKHINNVYRIPTPQPGLMSKYKDNKPLFSDLWRSRVARGLIRSRLTPAQIQSMKAEELIGEFERIGYALSRKWAEKIGAYTKRTLAPHDKIVEIDLDLVNRDLNLLEALESSSFFYLWRSKTLK